MTIPPNETPLNLIRGPARQPGWAQLMRLGGDGVAILLDELRKSVGRIDGVVERLHYSAREARWLIRYDMGNVEVFAVRISPGLLQADMALNSSEVVQLLRDRKLSGTVKDAVRVGPTELGSRLVRLPLKDRRGVRAFVNLARAKNRLIAKAGSTPH